MVTRQAGIGMELFGDARSEEELSVETGRLPEPTPLSFVRGGAES
jgi:hypothetical protein